MTKKKKRSPKKYHLRKTDFNRRILDLPLVFSLFFSSSLYFSVSSIDRVVGFIVTLKVKTMARKKRDWNSEAVVIDGRVPFRSARIAINFAARLWPFSDPRA